MRKRIVQFANFLLKKFDNTPKKIVPQAHPFERTQTFTTVVPPDVDKLRFSLSYNSRRDPDKTRFLEDLKREVLREIDKNFFYYFPVTHHRVSYMDEEEHAIEFYFKRHHN